MKISIITPTFNSETTIADTIDSIVRQNYKNIEYIIIDGASSDKTLEIVSRYKTTIPITIISEPDKGIYDAMNKGIARATGDIVGILNSDDFFHTDTTLDLVATAFTNTAHVDAVYGDLLYIDQYKKDKVTRIWKSGSYDRRKLQNGWMMPHPTFFVRNSIYKKIQPWFRLTLPIAADYELMFRMLYLHTISVSYIPHILVTMRRGGNSGRNIRNRFKGWSELRQSWKINGCKVPRLFITRRILHKLFQFIPF